MYVAVDVCEPLFYNNKKTIDYIAFVARLDPPKQIAVGRLGREESVGAVSSP